VHCLPPKGGGAVVPGCSTPLLLSDVVPNGPGAFEWLPVLPTGPSPPDVAARNHGTGSRRGTKPPSCSTVFWCGASCDLVHPLVREAPPLVIRGSEQQGRN